MFSVAFPSINRLFNRIKVGDQGNLAKILLRIESYLVLEIVTRRISIEAPTLPIFTVHDSVITTVGNEEFVENILKDELEKAIGTPAQCKREYWNPENLIYEDATKSN